MHAVRVVSNLFTTLYKACLDEVMDLTFGKLDKVIAGCIHAPSGDADEFPASLDLVISSRCREITLYQLGSTY